MSIIYAGGEIMDVRYLFVIYLRLDVRYLLIPCVGVGTSRSAQSHIESMLRAFTHLPQARIFKCLGYKSFILEG